MVLAAIAPIFLIVIAGFFIRRIGVLSAAADATLLRICLNVLYPCLVVATVVGNPALHRRENVWMPPLAGFVTVMAGFAASYAGARLLRLPRGSETRTFAFVTGLYNYGYMAIPVVDNLFGAKTLGVLFTHNLGVELAFWIGLSIVLAGPGGDEAWWRRVLNAPVIAILVSLTLNFVLGGRGLPDWIAGAALAAASAAAMTPAMLKPSRMPRAPLGSDGWVRPMAAKTSGWIWVATMCSMRQPLAASMPAVMAASTPAASPPMRTMYLPEQIERDSSSRTSPDFSMVSATANPAAMLESSIRPMDFSFIIFW